MIMRKLGFVVTPEEAHEANGVTIRRSIGNERMILLDPFLLCDHLTIGRAESDSPIGFPRHPHRGIETLTLVFDGYVTHKDSIGNESQVGPGATQWMTAGSGIFHEEYLTPLEGKVEALQLWFNLPQSEKMKPAGYTPAHAEDVPTIELEGATLRLIAGEYQSTKGFFQDIATHPNVFEIDLFGGKSVVLETSTTANAWAYLISGDLESDGISIQTPKLIVFSDGGQVKLSSSQGAKVVFCSAEPLNEPVLQYRSIVMNTVEDIRIAEQDLRNGTFTQH